MREPLNEHQRTELRWLHNLCRNLAPAVGTINGKTRHRIIDAVATYIARKWDYTALQIADFRDGNTQAVYKQLGYVAAAQADPQSDPLLLDLLGKVMWTLEI